MKPMQKNRVSDPWHGGASRRESRQPPPCLRCLQHRQSSEGRFTKEKIFTVQSSLEPTANLNTVKLNANPHFLFSAQAEGGEGYVGLRRNVPAQKTLGEVLFLKPRLSVRLLQGQ